ncbi:MAG TPA: S8 family serine peptidase [Acidimicrobiales bacterium]
MTGRRLPAWARPSEDVRLAGPASLDDLSAAWAWGGATGLGVRVAVVDSGVDADHEALDGRVDEDGGVEVVAGADGGVEVRAGPHRDSFGHGTACAGIVHAIAPDATITSVKVLGDRLGATGAAFARGLEWAVAARFDVINLSLGTSRRDLALRFHDLCDDAYFHGSLIVTAASNTGRPSYPSTYASVASVACNLARDPFRFHFNPDPPTEFLARGVDVEAPWRAGTRVRTTGNSYAAATLTGIAALVRSKHPDLRPFQLKTVLWATAANVLEAGREAPARSLSRSLARRGAGGGRR